MTKIVSLGGFALAVLAFVVSDLVNRGYDPVDETISRYVNQPHGWLVTVGLLAMAAGSAAATLRVSAVGSGIRWLWMWTGCVLIAAIFPADPPGNWDSPSMSETVHGLAAWLAFIALQIAIVRLTLAWPVSGVVKRALVALASVSGVVFVLFVVAMVDEMALTHTAPLGLVERVLIVVNLAWLALAAFSAASLAGVRASEPEAGVSGRMGAMVTSETK